MRNATIPICVALLLALAAPRAHADTTDLYDLALSTSTGITADWEDGAANNPLSYVSTTMVCCGDGTGGTTPGLGTLSYTFNPGPSTPTAYTVSLYFDYDVSTPFFNEYGAINNAGSAQSGISYEIFNGDTTSSNIVLFGACGTAGCEVYGNADDLNNVPGTTSNYLASCTGADCNADVAMALTYSFTLDPGQQAVLSAASSLTNPGGFSLETLHPVDPDNSSASQLYLTGSYTIGPVGGAPPPPPPIPEPSTWVLLGTAFAFVAVRGARRKARA
jgi:hypothetical protein